MVIAQQIIVMMIFQHGRVERMIIVLTMIVGIVKMLWSIIPKLIIELGFSLMNFFFVCSNLLLLTELTQTKLVY
jgi:hypothetical protein